MHTQRLLSAALTGILLFITACHSTDKQSAIAFNDKIVDGVHEVDKEFFEYMEAAGSFSPELMSREADSLQLTASNVSHSLEQLPDIPEGTELREAAMDYLFYIQGPARIRIEGILGMMGTGLSDSSGAMMAVIDLRHDTLMKDTDDLFNRIGIAQEEFAETFGFDLEE